MNRLKHPLKFVLILLALTLSLWLFRGPLVAKAVEWWNLDDVTRGKWNDWSTIIVNLWTFLATIIAGIKWFGKKEDKTNPSNPPVVIVTATETPNPDNLRTEYYQALRKTCQRINLSLVDMKFDELTKHMKNAVTLPVVYQEMDVVSIRRQPDEDGAGRMSLRGDDRKPLTLACAEEKHRRLVILGDAGSGKSMFMDNLAWQIAGTHLEDQQNERPPGEFCRWPVVRVRLRSAALLLQEKAGDEDFLRLAMRQEIMALMGEEKSDALWKTLEMPLLKQGIILLDGMDEVPETGGLRKAMLDAVDNLLTELGKEARLLITSRPSAFERHEDWLQGLACVELQPMSNAQVEHFITHWYLLLRETRDRSEELSRKLAHELFVELQDRDYLLDPARRPLILTLLTSLHFVWGILPHSRAKLYQEAVELMLERWTQRIHGENEAYPLEDFERKAMQEGADTRMTALQKLAMDASLKKTLQIPDTQIMGLFSVHLSANCNAKNLLDFVRYRSGILKPGLGKNFEFYHRSFQDYLAALDITEQSDWLDQIDKLLRGEGGREWWEQVFLLLVSAKVEGKSKPDAIALMRRYVPTQIPYDTYPEEDWQRLFLAAKAAVEQQLPLKSYANQYYRELRNDLQTHLLTLVERGHDYALPVALRAEAGRLLGELGDPRPGVTVIKDGDGNPKLFNGLKLPDFVWEPIPKGAFLMGTEGEEGDADEKPAHQVTVEAFSLSRYPVTNAQYACFVEAGGYSDEQYWQEPKTALDWLRGGKADLALLDDNPEYKKSYEDWLAQEKTRRQPWFWEQRQWNNPNHPVVGVCWYEALAFCQWLNAQHIYPGRVRLPTEAEWEYAARGWEGLRYAWGNDPDPSLGNYFDTGLRRTSTVGLFPAGKSFADRGIKLYDMSGNVWEWTSSQWGGKVNAPDFTYTLWVKQAGLREDLNPLALRVMRGGSWYFRTDLVRCAVRDGDLPLHRLNNLGFRLVLGSPW